ncbi:MAG TPA: DUF4954 family protein, partial [Flavisolibacter sp.]|nr:DUF4954 family protein [Flavisolibacter sp.]
GPKAQSQIGEGCELVNGIIDYGCRIFYGVKAVRFVMASNSQLKYGARLINSYLGNNSTISCCEVLNSLIFPAHEQHHNNSFLCAALVMGQSNIAAGATIGSNHNSRAADGELVTSRGFWPGLCVSLKHNSKFATFTLIAKGDYPYELDIPLPFSLVSNDEANNRLIVMPAYWFMYNMYALARNGDKYINRDRRIDKIQNIEYEVLAPDSVNDIFSALELLQEFTALAFDASLSETTTSRESISRKGEALLNNEAVDLGKHEILAKGFENHARPVQLIKVREAYVIYKRMVVYYGVTQLLQFIRAHKISTFAALMQSLPQQPVRLQWINLGGQLVPSNAIETLISIIKSRKIENWDDIHDFYRRNSALYAEQKLQHAFASLLEILQLQFSQFTPAIFCELLQQLIGTKEWVNQNIYESRAKDYQNSFRKMAYNNEQEMEAVVGKLEDNVFIAQQNQELSDLRAAVEEIRLNFGL